MANKKTKKKSTQSAAPASSAQAEASKDAAKKAAPAKADAKAAKKAEKKKAEKKKAEKNKKPGLIARAKNYLASIRSEMKRVTWPTKKELVNYSVAVCVSLVVVGIAIAVLDLVIGEGLMLFAGLRG